jgi:hypothetical protein
MDMLLITAIKNEACICLCNITDCISVTSTNYNQLALYWHMTMFETRVIHCTGLHTMHDRLQGKGKVTPVQAVEALRVVRG